MRKVLRFTRARALIFYPVYKVPRSHKGFLIEPSPDNWRQIVEVNRDSSPFFRPWTLGCAHQSSLYHPGVLFREALVNASSFERKVHVSCDTSPVPGPYIEIPSERKKLKLEYYSAGKSECYACTVPPSEEKIESFMRMSPSNETRQFFKNLLYYVRRSENAAELNVTAKEYYLKSFGYKLNHIYLSLLLKTGMYRSFLEKINCDKNRFIEVYNKSLESLPYQSGIGELKKGKLPFRNIKGMPYPHPKALVLNIFLRLYVFDLYIQGTGESLYSAASDYIIKNFFGITPPETVTVSYTLYHGARDPEGLKSQLKREELKLREMNCNPQDFAEKENTYETKIPDSEFISATEKKKKYREIKKKKDLIRKSIEPLIEIQKREIKKLKEIMQVTSREYPFFVYNRADIEYLFEKALEEGSKCG